MNLMEHELVDKCRAALDEEKHLPGNVRDLFEEIVDNGRVIRSPHFPPYEQTTDVIERQWRKAEAYLQDFGRLFA